MMDISTSASYAECSRNYITRNYNKCGNVIASYYWNNIYRHIARVLYSYQLLITAINLTYLLGFNSIVIFLYANAL